MLVFLEAGFSSESGVISSAFTLFFSRKNNRLFEFLFFVMIAIFFTTDFTM